MFSSFGGGSSTWGGGEETRPTKRQGWLFQRQYLDTIGSVLTDQRRKRRKGRDSSTFGRGKREKKERRMKKKKEKGKIRRIDLNKWGKRRRRLVLSEEDTYRDGKKKEALDARGRGQKSSSIQIDQLPTEKRALVKRRKVNRDWGRNRRICVVRGKEPFKKIYHSIGGKGFYRLKKGVRGLDWVEKVYLCWKKHFARGGKGSHLD